MEPLLGCNRPTPSQVCSTFGSDTLVLQATAAPRTELRKVFRCLGLMRFKEASLDEYVVFSDETTTSSFPLKATLARSSFGEMAFIPYHPFRIAMLNLQFNLPNPKKPSNPKTLDHRFRLEDRCFLGYQRASVLRAALKNLRKSCPWRTPGFYWRCLRFQQGRLGANQKRVLGVDLQLLRGSELQIYVICNTRIPRSPSS